MNLNLHGKTVLVTGSSRGIGFSIAKTLHSEGCQVALNGRNSNELYLASSKLSNSIGVVGDVSIPNQAKNTVFEVLKKFGKLDILVCSVGCGRSVNPGNETFEEWNRILALNLWSTTNTIEAAKNALIDAKGVVVCISSICGIEVIKDAPITYSVSKAALNAYVRGISRPLGKKGVRINAIAPGNIIFEGSTWSTKLKNNYREVTAMLNNEVSLSTFGFPTDIANLVAYLASQCSSFATGSIWTVDGGQLRS